MNHQLKYLGGIALISLLSIGCQKENIKPAGQFNQLAPTTSSGRGRPTGRPNKNAGSSNKNTGRSPGETKAICLSNIRRLNDAIDRAQRIIDNVKKTPQEARARRKEINSMERIQRINEINRINSTTEYANYLHSYINRWKNQIMVKEGSRDDLVRQLGWTNAQRSLAMANNLKSLGSNRHSSENIYDDKLTLLSKEINDLEQSIKKDQAVLAGFEGRFEYFHQFGQYPGEMLEVGASPEEMDLLREREYLEEQKPTGQIESQIQSMIKERNEYIERIHNIEFETEQ